MATKILLSIHETTSSDVLDDEYHSAAEFKNLSSKLIYKSNTRRLHLISTQDAAVQRSGELICLVQNGIFRFSVFKNKQQKLFFLNACFTPIVEETKRQMKLQGTTACLRNG